MPRLVLVLLAAAALLPAVAAGQGSGQPFLTVYPPDAYDGAAQTWDVVEDERGFLYLANINGVKVFDGARWRSVTLPSRSNPRSIAAAGGRVFVGAYDEFGALTRDSTGALDFESFRERLPGVPTFGDVLDIEAVSGRAFFIAESGLFEWTEADGGAVARWEPPGTLRCATWAGGRLVLHVDGVGLVAFREGRFRPLPGGEALAELPVQDIVPYGGALVAVTGAGLFTYRGGAVQPFPADTQARLAPLRPFSATALPDGRLAVATRVGGLVVLSADGQVSFVIDEASGLPSADVKSGVVGRDGDLWLALQNGVARLEVSVPLLRYRLPQGLGEHVIALARHDGALYAATNSGVLRIVEGAQGVTRYEPVPGIRVMCQALLPTENGILAGCGEETLLIQGREIVSRTPMPSAVHVFLRSTRTPQRIWAGLKEGLAVLSFGGQPRTVGRVPRVSGSVRTLVEEGDRLWVGTDFTGATRVGLPLGENLQPRDAERVPQWDEARVNVFDVDGAPLFSSDAPGLGRYVGGPEPFAPDPALDSVLAGDRANLFRLAVGPGGDLWVRAGGIETRLRKTSGTYRWEEAPLQRIPWASTFAILPEADGTVWYGGTFGLIRYDRSTTWAPEAPAQALVRRVSTVGADSLLYAGAPGAASGLALPFGLNALRFAYAAPIYTRPEEVRYQVRLDGLDDAWSEWTEEVQKDYTNLPPGAYRFRVRARDLYGQVTEEGGYAFTIVAPWYRTPWALAIGALLAIGLIAGSGWGVGRARTRLLRARQAELEAEVHDRTEALALENRRTEAALLDAERARADAEAAAETVRSQREELARLNAAKSRFFANVSHEFRTPLTLAIGPLEDLRDGLYGPLAEPAHEPVGLALRNSRRLLGLINQILDVARLDAREVRLTATRTDLGAFVDGLVGAFRPLADRLGIALRFDPPARPLEVALDADQFDKVVSNLLSNAFKFTPEAGAVTVGLAAEGGRAVLSVADSGAGIAPEHLPHVFDRFYQVDGATVARQPGTGIGLALARELVHLHGGTIHAESTPGAGSRFTVALPLADAEGPLAPAPALRAAPAPHAGDLLAGSGTAPAPEPDDPGDDVTTVLVVDDHADIRAYVRRHLEGARNGHPRYRVIEAADGEEGLARARAHLPDLVVSDVMMPKLDGVALCRALKEDPATDFLPVVLLTAKAGEEATLEGLGVGADDYVTKPFNVRELAARVDALIANRQRLRERFAGAPEDRPPLPPGIDLDALDPDDAAFVRSVLDAIQAGLADEAFGVEALAEAVGVSRSALYRRFRAVEATPQTALRDARLARGERLLRQGAGTVSEVAYAVGFKSVAQFSRAFRDRYGESPSDVGAGAA